MQKNYTCTSLTTHCFNTLLYKEIQPRGTKEVKTRGCRTVKNDTEEGRGYGREGGRRYGHEGEGVNLMLYAITK